MHCPSCGAPIQSASSQFCTNCGGYLRQAAPTPPAGAPLTPPPVWTPPQTAGSWLEARRLALGAWISRHLDLTITERNHATILTFTVWIVSIEAAVAVIWWLLSIGRTYPPDVFFNFLYAGVWVALAVCVITTKNQGARGFTMLNVSATLAVCLPIVGAIASLFSPLNYEIALQPLVRLPAVIIAPLAVCLPLLLLWCLTDRARSES